MPWQHVVYPLQQVVYPLQRADPFEAGAGRTGSSSRFKQLRKSAKTRFDSVARD